MDFHGMKRKDLQTLCKKHGIPGNLKNIEMASRLASVFQKETVNIPEDSVEADGIKDDVVVSKEAKRVRFSPENEVFEFTRSAQKCQRKNVRMRSQGHAQDLQQGGIELRRSKRIVTRLKVRTSRLVNDIDVQTNTQNRRRSIRLKARAANSSMEGETFDGRPLCSAKEGKKETKTKQSEGSTVVKSQQGKEPLIDCEVQTAENYRMMKVQDVSKVEKVPRRSKRPRKDINVLMDKRPVKAAKREKSLSELLVDGQALKGDKESKRTSGNDREDKKLPPSSKHTALDNMSNSLNCCSVIDCERDGASVDNVKKPNVNDETQVRVRFTRNSSRHDSFKAPILVEGNLVEKKMDKTLEKKQDRSAEPGMNMETTSTQGNLTPIELLDQYAQFEQEAAGGTNVASGGSSKKSKTMNQECVKDMSHGIIENSPSSSEAKATESVTVVENVLDSTPGKSVDTSQRTNTQELNSELMEGKREEKLEHDTILMPVIEEDKEEVSSRPVLLLERLSPALVPLAISNPEAELGVPTSHSLVKDIASTVIVEENTKTKEEIFICGPISELKEDNSVAKLGNIEAILENSAECWKEIHPGKDDEKGSLEKKIQAENIHGNFSEYSTENSKVGCINVGHSGNLEEVKDDSLEKTEQTISRESGCKLNELELRRWSSTDFTSFSPKEDNVSKCFEEDEVKALSQPLPSNKDVTVFDESDVFTTSERNLMLMEKLSENDSVTHDKEAVESHVVVFTSPRIVEAGKEEDDTSTNFPDESDAPNTTERYSMSEGSRRTNTRM